MTSDKSASTAQAQVSIQKLIDMSPNTIGYWDADLKNVHANKAYIEFFGKPPEQIHGQHIRDVLGPEIFEKNLPFLTRVLKGEVQSFERVIPSPDHASVKHTLTKYIPDTLGDTVVGFFATVTDVSDLKERELLRDAILNSVAAEIAVLDRNGNIIAVNKRWTEVSIENGIEPGKPTPNTDVGANYLAVCGGGPEEPAENKENDEAGALIVGKGIRAVLEGRLPSFSIEYPCDSPNKRRWFSLNVTPLDGRGGSSGNECVVVSHTDITERKLLEEALQKSEKQFLEVMYCSPDAILLLYNDVFVDCNQAAMKMLGISEKSEALEAHPSSLSPPLQPDGRASSEKADALLRAALEYGFQRFEWLHKRPNGEVFLVEVSLTPMIYKGKWMLHVLWRDLTEVKRKEQELVHLNTRLTLALRAGGIGVWDYDISSNALFWDDQMFAMYGIDKGKFSQTYDAWSSAVHPDDIGPANAEFESVIAGKKEYDTEFRVVWPNGSIRHIRALATVQRDASGAALRVVGANWDITKQREDEQVLSKVQHAAKLVTLGEMAAGMAHEINQPLAGISLAAQTITKMKKKNVLTDSELQMAITDIQTSVNRASKVITNVRKFARQDIATYSLIDLNETITSAMVLMGEQLRVWAIDVTVELGKDLPPILGEPFQLQQVWINIISNARDALEEKATAGVYAKCIKISSKPAKEPGRILVQISDNGAGMSEEVRMRIFEPFFTTKPVGKGTGLGLSITFGILEAHKASVEVESAPQEGATFIISFPVSS